VKQPDISPPQPIGTLPDALACWPAIAARLDGCQAAVFLDFDGTLAPIAPTPSGASLPDDMRARLASLAERCLVAIVTGRSRVDAERRVGLENVIIAGSHGFDIKGPPGSNIRRTDGAAFEETIRTADRALADALAPFDGWVIEEKPTSIAVHYRNVQGAEVEGVLNAVERVLESHPRLRATPGKKVIELLPRVDWNKGKAVAWLCDTLGLFDGGTLPIYIGDDVTDEDGFRALHGRGLAIVVGGAEPESLTRLTHADYRLDDPAAVSCILDRVIAVQAGRKSPLGRAAPR
jgi:trehalose 6-phosphate phosphatase